MGEKISVGKGFVLAFIMTVLLIVFSLVTLLFSITEAWAGYLFFWFFSSFRGFDKSTLPPDVLNSLAGIGLGFLMFYCKNTYGMSVFLLVIVVTLIVILFFSVTKLIPWVIGDATFLFFTVLTSNLFLEKANYVQITIAYISGVIFFTITLLGLLAIMNKKKKPETPTEKNNVLE